MYDYVSLRSVIRSPRKIFLSHEKHPAVYLRIAVEITLHIITDNDRYMSDGISDTVILDTIFGLKSCVITNRDAKLPFFFKSVILPQNYRLVP